MPAESRVFLHPDSYVEMVFVGWQEVEQLSKLIEQARHLLTEHGPMSLVVDGRNGRIQPNFSNFSHMMNLSRFPNILRLYILTSADPDKMEAIQGPSVITSILTAVLGFRPIYSSDEEKIRRKARQDGEGLEKNSG
jgi:hypothetical protein